MVNAPIRYDQETSMDQEIALMKKCLAAQTGDYANWHPIAMDWFNRWKVYVNFDRNVPEPRDPEVYHVLTVSLHCLYVIRPSISVYVAFDNLYMLMEVLVCSLFT